MGHNRVILGSLIAVYIIAGVIAAIGTTARTVSAQALAKMMAPI